MSALSKYKFISCETGPNSTAADAWLAFKLFLFPWLVKTDDSQNFVSCWFRQYLGLAENYRVYQTDSGRTALYLLLKSLNLPAESEVLIQGFSCVLVPNSVLQAGYRPVVCEIEGQTFNFDLNKIEHSITPQTCVWIVQHTFGTMPDMARVKQICERHNIILIEDCAHALGAVQDGQKAGTFGAAAIFSFGRDKMVTSVMGGLAVINKEYEDWKKNLEQEYQKLSSIPAVKEKQALFFTILAGWFLPFYHLILGKLALKLSLKLKLIPDVYTSDEAGGTNIFQGGFKYSPKLAALLQKQLSTFEVNIRHRQQLAQIYCQELNLKFHKGSSYLRFPLNLEELSPNCLNYPDLYSKILANLRKEGIFAGLWYNQMFITPQTDLSKFGYKKSSLQVTERLLGKCVLNLPTNIKTSKKDAVRIAQVIQKTAQF